MKIDYIIVGQGLAGSALSLQLLKRKRKFLVIDQPEKNNSSRIAAGLFNPVTGKNMVKTWLADQVFPYLHTFYQQAEFDTQKRFFYPLPLYRPFISVEEQNEWMAKSAEATYGRYIKKIHTSSMKLGIKDPIGGLLLKQCGYLNTRQYIDAVSIIIRQHATLLQDDFCEDELKVGEGGVQYRNYEAEKIIFCNGVHTNKWFKWLPLKALKGETINIKTVLPQEIIINRGVYILPSQEPNQWRVGATYNYNDQTMAITAEAKTELEEKLGNLITHPYSILFQEFGMRPTTSDHRPLLGAHPEYKPVIIFNGLGTKGVSLAPYFSEVLVHWLENEGTLNKAVDIDRYKSVYWSSPK